MRGSGLRGVSTNLSTRDVPVVASTVAPRLAIALSPLSHRSDTRIIEDNLTLNMVCALPGQNSAYFQVRFVAALPGTYMVPAGAHVIRGEAILTMRTVFVFHRKEAHAQAYESDAGGFTVEAGSTACKTVSKSFANAPGLSRLRNALIQLGILTDADNVLRFTRDYEFQSPSTAAAIICGTSINGRRSWRTKDGIPLKDLHSTKV